MRCTSSLAMHNWPDGRRAMPDGKITDPLTDREMHIVALAAEVGARAACDAMDEREQQKRKAWVDWRYHNVKMLLKNYRIFKIHLENAVYEARELDRLDIIEDLMDPRKDQNEIVNSIKRSVERTFVIVKHVEAMCAAYHSYCYKFGGLDDQRRWRVIDELYIRELEPDQKPATVDEIAQREYITSRTVYKDIDAAVTKLATFFFGVDFYVQ